MKHSKTSRPFILEVEFEYNLYHEVKGCKTYEEAVHEAEKLYDKGETGDFRIIAAYWDVTRLKNFMFAVHTCPVCRREVRRHQMERTRDYHGQPYRLVCGTCNDRIMRSRGYDGEAYDEADENLNDY